MNIINNITSTNAQRQTVASNNVEAKANLDPLISEIAIDAAELSISGKASSLKIAVPVAKFTTAGLIITDIEITGKDGSGSVMISGSRATVSNEKAATGASENILGNNSPSIDKPPKNLESPETIFKDFKTAKEMMDKTKQNIIHQASVAVLAQGNSNPNTVLQLLR